MPVKRRYRCQNCGHRFEVDVLTEQEKEQAKRREQRLYPIACPECKRQAVREGWH